VTINVATAPERLAWAFEQLDAGLAKAAAPA
jgi:hypothetical protein